MSLENASDRNGLGYVRNQSPCQVFDSKPQRLQPLGLFFAWSKIKVLYVLTVVARRG